jgi:hypothetical protein
MLKNKNVRQNLITTAAYIPGPTMVGHGGKLLPAQGVVVHCE